MSQTGPHAVTLGLQDQEDAQLQCWLLSLWKCLRRIHECAAGTLPWVTISLPSLTRVWPRGSFKTTGNLQIWCRQGLECLSCGAHPMVCCPEATCAAAAAAAWGNTDTGKSPTDCANSYRYTCVICTTHSWLVCYAAVGNLGPLPPPWRAAGMEYSVPMPHGGISPLSLCLQGRVQNASHPYMFLIWFGFVSLPKSPVELEEGAGGTWLDHGADFPFAVLMIVSPFL